MVSFGVDKNVLELGDNHYCTIMHMTRIIEVYTLNVVWKLYVNIGATKILNPF